MGILNITPDSFSDGGKYFNLDDAIKHAKELIESGVNIIDIGGESTRPGAKQVSEEEELKRVIPVIKELRGAASQLKFLISIDTYKANVAKKALEAGADMVNDVSGLTKDPNMIKIVADAKCPVVIMHNRGIPATKPHTLHLTPQILEEVYRWLLKQTNHAIINGVKRGNIIIDPGIGFGKSAEEDLYLIENLKELKSLGFPVLIGLSRKSFIKKLFPNDSLETKSKELVNLAIKNGADILRVH